MEVKLSKYGKIISTDETSRKVLKKINESLASDNNAIIDAFGVVISTKSARLIFGNLYKNLTKKIFNEKIKFKNASESFMFAVNEGITTELSE